ncbi:hypothetical protein GCAAIG_05360 [Candidatus Electronema halotolerans]
MTNEELLEVIRKAKEKGTTSLYLSGKQLIELPPEIGQLTNLTCLELQGNRLTSLPQEICQLTKLQELNLRGNRLTTLPPELFQLTNLTRLELNNNQLATLPPEFCQLTSLTVLLLSSNQLTALPLEICQLTNLTKLNLYANRLNSLPPEISQLNSLTLLNLDTNQLSALPSEIGQLTKLTELYLSGNPLTSPPIEIARQGIEAIRQYFANLQAEDQPLNQVKVLLVGDGAAGKTSLVKKLLGEEFDQHEDTTHGISIRGWDVTAGGQPIKVNIWDFGGQEIMHATHQFFLSKRSLYVLVLDGRKDERPEYWLQHIESFGGDSPVLVVLNKQDANPSFDINRPFLQAKYPSIKGFFRTSCADGDGISRLRETLLKELARVEMIGIRWPGSWFLVKEQIARLGRSYISSREYGSICVDAGITEQASQETLVDLLHDLGVAVHFKDFILDATHVLDPVWVTNAVYKIINSGQVAADKGILRLESLKDILRQQPGEPHSYPPETHVFIIKLMKKFELCWELDSERVLIPQLLGVVEPDFTFDEADALQFVLHYHDFLPPSVMPRFMVKVHQQIKDALSWRTGAVLQDRESGSEAVVRADTEARRINLWVNGPRRKEYLHFLWFSLREINNTFKHLDVSERIPMPDDPQRSADYETLINLAEAGSDVFIPDGSKKCYSVKELLGLVEPSRDDEMLELLRMMKAQMDEKELLMLKPSFSGFGIDLKQLWKILSGRKERQ